MWSMIGVDLGKETKIVTKLKTFLKCYVYIVVIVLHIVYYNHKATSQQLSYVAGMKHDRSQPWKKDKNCDEYKDIVEIFIQRAYFMYSNQNK